MEEPTKQRKSSIKRFNVLEYNRISMGWLGMGTKYLEDPINEFFRDFRSYYTLFIVFTFTFMASVVYMYENITHFEMVSESGLVAIAAVQVGGMFLTIGINMKKVKVLNITLQKIADDPSADVSSIYWQVELKCRKYTTVIGCYPLNLIFIGAFIYSVISYSKGNDDTSKWLLPYTISVPFDTKTVRGWYILWFIQTNIGITYGSILITISSYFVCCCFYIGGICEHFDMIMNSLKSQTILTRTKTNRVKYEQQHKDIRTKLANAVVVHNNVFELFQNVATLNSGVIFWLLPGNVIFFALSLYNTEHSTSDAVMIAFHIVCIITSMIWPYLFCYYADYITDRILKIGLSAYDTNWFEYPIEAQRYFVLIIARSQEPVHFDGFNLIYCTLEVFGKLFKTSCSYYVLFRSLSHR